MVLESSCTILYVAKISYQSDNWFGNCWGNQNCTQTHVQTNTDTHTHTDTDTHTHTHTHTDTHRCLFYVSFFCENAETRLKTTKSEGK